MTKPFLDVALVLGILVTGQSGARAGEEEQVALCREDVMRLCLTAIPDRGRIVACMRAQEASLSPACRAVFDAGPRDDGARRTAIRR
ncbi:hypothetical protein [Methylobacterium sp. V23]|uniref:hypothetical protein n=1 Tax=Methylobacterium sp. V23 TaxID=2044878 RepID=UPI000CDB3C7A|nr:hypothetical protein [Methylobacterium sp. V23]POR41277.1 hypothetical protein CRT23_19120 [Methylobacterium sp. V23]